MERKGMVFDKFNGFAIDNRSNLKKAGKKWGERKSEEEIESEKNRREKREESEQKVKEKIERWEEKCVLWSKRCHFHSWKLPSPFFSHYFSLTHSILPFSLYVLFSFSSPLDFRMKRFVFYSRNPENGEWMARKFSFVQKRAREREESLREGERITMLTMVMWFFLWRRKEGNNNTL